MDYWRVLQVPFRPACLMLIAIVSVLLSFFASSRQLGAVGMLSLVGTFILQVWVIKYCYVLIGHLANGRDDPPALDLDMLSPFEIRPWVQVAIIVAAGALCWVIGGKTGVVLGLCFLLLLPASIALLGYGELPWQAANPLALYRVVRGLGPYYPGLLAAMFLYLAIGWFVASRGIGTWLSQAVNLTLEVSYFGLIGGALYFRRRQLGYEAQVSPERTAARDERERAEVRARMLDEVFTQVRIGKHVDSTRPLADWFRGLDGDVAARDAGFVVEQAIGWQSPPALNAIGSTLIRHLLRAGRPDTALDVFRKLRASTRTFTMDSADDLRSLAEYAESTGDAELAASMRLETPVFHPRR